MTVAAQRPSVVPDMPVARDLAPAGAVFTSAGAMFTSGAPRTLRDEIIMLRDLTSRQDLLEQLCGSVVRACGLDRALFSVLDDRTWCPSGWHSRWRRPAEAEFLSWLRSGPILELDARSPEHSAISTATVVHDGRHDGRRASSTWLPPSLAACLELGPHLVAPVFCEGRAIGLLHADRGGRPLLPAAEELLATFLEIFALLLERATARQRSREDLLEPTTTCSQAAVSRDVNARWCFADNPAPPMLDIGNALQPQARSMDRLAGLTARQVEVLAAMATGAPNAQIAASLFISTTTVKSHVRGILATLGVPNRSGAIALYLRQTMNRATRVQ